MTLDDLQRLHDRCANAVWPLQDEAAERELADAMFDSLPALLRVARAAAEVAGNVPTDIDERIRWLEVQVGREEWAELIAAVRALEATDA